MNSSNDLIITVLQGQQFSWESVRPCAVSLTKAGFQGTKVVLVNDINAHLKSGLVQSGYQVIEYERENSSRRFYTTRHAPLVNFLKENYSKFRYVIFADIRDVVYQTNPSIWLENNLSPSKVVGITESIKFKDERCYNDPQIAHLCGIQGVTVTYEWLREQDVCNYGLLAGEAKEMYEILSKIKEVLDSYSGDLIDQAVLNYIIRVSPFKAISRVTTFSEGFGAQLHWVQVGDKALLTNEVPWLDKNTGLVYPAGKSEPFAVLHHYDVDPEWGRYIHGRYVEPLYTRAAVVAPTPVPSPVTPPKPGRFLRKH